MCDKYPEKIAKLQNSSKIEDVFKCVLIRFRMYTPTTMHFRKHILFLMIAKLLTSPIPQCAKNVKWEPHFLGYFVHKYVIFLLLLLLNLIH